MFDLEHSQKIRLTVVLIFLVAFLAANFDFPTYWNKAVEGIGLDVYRFERDFRLGLDLQGGTHLTYDADLSEIETGEEEDAMSGVRDVIERRVNMYGVAEPRVQTEQSGDQWRLIVELAGIKDVSEAIEMIGETPYLDFRLLKEGVEFEDLQAELSSKSEEEIDFDDYFVRTDLDGRLLKNSQLNFSQTTQQPQVGLEFNEEGKELFADITGENIERVLAIFLDGEPISMPRINDKIVQGQAVIEGDFSIEEAKTLVRRLNAGALPVPVELVSQRTVGAALGMESLDKSVKAALWGILAVVIFLIAYYRLPGLAAVVALAVYGSLVLAVFKLVPVTLTLSGIAGFILSLGMAVDANVLIFERLKEELGRGHELGYAIREGFTRAWPSIRDGNFSTLITSAILYWVGVGFVKGFALTLGLGVLVSMFTAVFFTKRLLQVIADTKLAKEEGWFSPSVPEEE